VCPAPIDVRTEGANQAFSGIAYGQGTSDTATAAVTLNIDKSAPLVQVTAPADGSATPTSPITVTGNFSAGGSPITSVLCNTTAAAFDNTTHAFSCNVALNSGANQIAVAVTDAAGNQGHAAVAVT